MHRVYCNELVIENMKFLASYSHEEQKTKEKKKFQNLLRAGNLPFLEQGRQLGGGRSEAQEAVVEILKGCC